MVLVTLGTQDKPFARLLEAVEKQIELGNISGEVVAQTGCTKFESNKMKVVDYLQLAEFKEIFNKADYIITHAGVGSILEGLRNGKKIIAVARHKEFGEHVNNHQDQILENFGKQGYIIPVYDLESLDDALKAVKDFEAKEYKWNNDNFINQLVKEIDFLCR